MPAYANFSRAELLAELDSITFQLASKHRELAALTDNHLREYYRAYKASDSSSVGGRERAAESASLDEHFLVLECRGDIAALAITITLLQTLLSYAEPSN